MIVEREPAEAYYEVAAFLGDEQLLAPHPDKGVLVTICGRDGHPTRWHLDALTARVLIAHVRDRSDLAVLGTCHFDFRVSMP